MIHLVASPFMQTLGWTLVHFLWQGAALGLLAWAALRLVRASPSTRYLIGVAALAAMLAAPIVTVGYLSNSGAGVGVGDSQGRLQPAPASALVEPVAPIEPVEPTVFAAISLLWLLGVAVLSTRLAGGWVLARRSARRGVRPVPPEIHALVRKIAGRLALERVVQVFESSAIFVPIMVGWIKPVVLLPGAALAGLAPEQLEALIAHELAHVRRHDYLVNLLQSAVETLLFYHPAVWWVSRQIRREREHCCDDLAIGVCGDRLVYATALADLAAMTTPRLALAASDGSLLHRVRRILGSRESHERSSGWPAAIFALLIVTALLPKGSVRADAIVAVTPERAAPEVVSARVEVGPPTTEAATILMPTEPRGLSHGDQVSGGVPGGVAGGVDGGVPDGVQRDQQREIEKRYQDELELLEKKLRAIAEQLEKTRNLEKFAEDQGKRSDKAKAKEDDELKTKYEKLVSVLKERAEKGELKGEMPDEYEYRKKLSGELTAQLDAIDKVAALSRVPADYVLATNDVVSVTVISGTDRLSVSRRAVEPNGTVTLPIAGTVKLAGLTRAQAQERLEREFSSRGFGGDATVFVAIIPARK